MTFMSNDDIFCGHENVSNEILNLSLKMPKYSELKLTFTANG